MVETAVTVAGDVKSTLAKAIPVARTCDSEAWISQLKEWQAQYPYKYKKDGEYSV